MKEWEPIRMADRLPELEISQVEPEQFAVEGVNEVARAMVRRSVGPATDIDRDLLVRNPAEALSQIPIEDPNLRFSPAEFKNPSDEILSLAIPLAQAKAEAVEQEFHLNPKEKSVLATFKRKVKKSTLGLATLSLVAMACTSEAKPTVNPASFNTEPVVTEVLPTETPTEVLTFQNRYEGHIALSVPGMPENIATRVSTENMRLDSNMLDALNEQGYSPVVSSARNSLGLLLMVGDKKATLINSPERLINYERAGRLGSEQGTVYYGRYGEPPLVYLLTLIPFEQDEGIYSAGAFVTSNVSGQEIGSFVIIFFDADTGKVIQTLPAEFPTNRNLRIEWQENGPVVYVDGQKQEY